MPTTPSIRDMAAQAVKNGAVDLSIGVIHSTPPAILGKLLSNQLSAKRSHTYADAAGFNQFLEPVLSLLHQENQKLTTENVIATSGATGGLVSALGTNTEPGDTVLMVEPFYPIYDWILRELKLSTEYVAPTDSFEVDVDSIIEKLPAVKALILSNPVNPTGTVIPGDTLLKIYEACQKNNVLLIVDEVYRDFIWEGEYTSLLSLTDDLSGLVVCRSFSKNLGLAGWRIGYAVSTVENCRAMTQAHEAYYIGTPAISQVVVGALVAHHTEEIESFISDLTALYRENREVLSQAFSENGFEPILKGGAYYMMLKHGREGDISITKELLDKGIAVAPGAPFWRPGTKDTGYVRAHFAVSEEDRQKAVTFLRNR